MLLFFIVVGLLLAWTRGLVVLTVDDAIVGDVAAFVACSFVTTLCWFVLSGLCSCLSRASWSHAGIIIVVVVIVAVIDFCNCYTLPVMLSLVIVCGLPLSFHVRLRTGSRRHPCWCFDDAVVCSLLLFVLCL